MTNTTLYISQPVSKVEQPKQNIVLNSTWIPADLLPLLAHSLSQQSKRREGACSHTHVLHHQGVCSHCLLIVLLGHAPAFLEKTMRRLPTLWPYLQDWHCLLKIRKRVPSMQRWHQDLTVRHWTWFSITMLNLPLPTWWLSWAGQLGVAVFLR